MNSTMKNILNSKRVCVVAGYFRLKGSAEVFSSGKYFDLCVSKNKEYSVKNAILVNVEEVFDLDSGKKLL
ncbi:MAG: hypothetical protein ABH803_03890 [Candidatus Micrarchaeota archaeon]